MHFPLENQVLPCPAHGNRCQVYFMSLMTWIPWGYEMVDWVFDAGEVEWMTERLANFWDRRLVAIAPAGFPVYGRLLHPAQAKDGTWVRWADVAAHNGVAMLATSDFSHIAMPQSVLREEEAWAGDPPEIGTLNSDQAEHLVDVLRSYTTTPNAVSFALWDGLGWDHATLYRPGHPSALAPDPIPPSVRNGPRMRIPGRDYIVYRGSIEEALMWMPSQHQTPHYWWPKDHAWAVAGDVDLPWSIVAGGSDLIGRLVHDTVVEVVPITESDTLDPRPAWLTAAIEQAVQDLIHHRITVIDTPRGAVSFCISESGVWLESGRGSRIRLHPERGARRTLEDQLLAHLSAALLSELNLY